MQLIKWSLFNFLDCILHLLSLCLELLHASTDYCVLLLSHRLCHHPSWKGFAWPGKENERYISSFQRRPKCAERWDSCGQSRSGKYRSLGSYVDSICRYTFAKKKRRKVDLISLSPRSDCFARSCWKSSEDYSIGYYFASFDLQICFNRQSCCIRNFASKISLGMNCVYHE